MDTKGAYRALLVERFSKRREANASYSLRAFARDLGWAPSRLSEVLGGKAGISLAKARSLIRKLGLSESEGNLFLSSVEASHGRSPSLRSMARSKLASSLASEIRPETFDRIRDWYHLAILELSQLKGFQATGRWLARTLGLHAAECHAALDRLKELGLLSWNARRRRWEIRPNSISARVPSSSIREYHRQMLRKASEAIELQSIDQRSLTATVLRVRRTRLPELFAKLEEVKREFVAAALADSDEGERDAVYAVTMQLYDLAPGLVQAER